MTVAAGVEIDRRLGGERSITMPKIDCDRGGARLRGGCRNRNIQKSVVVEVSGRECSAERDIGSFWSAKTTTARVWSKHQLWVQSFSKIGSDGDKVRTSAVAKVTENEIGNLKCSFARRGVNSGPKVS